MKKILFVIAEYQDYRKEIFESIISPRNKQFAEKHNYKYVEIKDINQLPKFREHPSWYKYFIINDLIDNNKVSDGDIITYIDADQYFVSIDNDLAPKEKSMSLAIDSGNTFCFSWNSLKINNWTKTHVKNIIDEDLYKRQIITYTSHPAFPNQPKTSFFQTHYEQAAFYILCGIKRHSDISFWDLENKGFHSEITPDTKYSLKEIEDNIEIFPTSYNVTNGGPLESNDLFHINKTKKEDVIIRHFAGGQNWNDVKNWINIC
jgi:hypothetical protein